VKAINEIRRLTLDEVGPREFSVVEPGACYRLEATGVGVTFEIDRLVWRSHELHGELVVRVAFAGTEAIGDVLSVATFNASSARARSERAQQLQRAASAPDVPWQPLLEQFCQNVLAAERTGDPAIVLRDVDATGTVHPINRIFGFQLPRRHPAIIFGDGGATKSLLALYLGGLMAEDGDRVLLADWELDAVDHRERYATLFGAEMPGRLLYARCARPLVHEVDRLKRIVRQQGVDYVIFDSVGFACHEAPETAVAALGYFQAVRQIGVGGLHIAHVSKSEHGDQRPFGSAFWHNSARATWNLKPTDESGTKTVGVFCRKHNLAKSVPAPFAYEVQVDGDRTRFRQTEITAVSDLAPAVPISQRVRAYLRGGARTREEIVAEFTDLKPETLRRIINREISHGRLVQFPSASGAEQIGLAARAS
jgi:hypothetical protein